MSEHLKDEYEKLKCDYETLKSEHMTLKKKLISTDALHTLYKDAFNDFVSASCQYDNDWLEEELHDDAVWPCEACMKLHKKTMFDNDQLFQEFIESKNCTSST